MPSKKISADAAPEVDLLHTLGLHEVRVRRQFEAICDQVRQRLLRGDLRPGDRLPGEREMAEQFKVSRSVVREATRSFESMSVLESRSGVNGGVLVRGSTLVGVMQAKNDMVSLGQMPIGMVTETCIEITCMAICLACVRATDADFDAIKADIDLHAELFKLGGGSRNARSKGEFCRLIAQSTHNDMIVMIVDSVSEVMRTLLARIDLAPHPHMIAVRRKMLRHLRARCRKGVCGLVSAPGAFERLPRIGEPGEEVASARIHWQRQGCISRRWSRCQEPARQKFSSCCIRRGSVGDEARILPKPGMPTAALQPPPPPPHCVVADRIRRTPSAVAMRVASLRSLPKEAKPSMSSGESPASAHAASNAFLTSGLGD